jgi:TP901 family phage tail tape measure protein
LQKQLRDTGNHATTLQRRLDDLKLTAMKAGIQMAGAFAIAKPIELAVVAAAKLQKEMIGIGLGARGSAADLDKLRGVIEDVAGKTMFSSVDVAKMGKQLATGTGWSRQQVAQDLPVFAQFADAQQIMKGTPYAQSVQTGIQLAHQAGYTKPEEISRYLDLLTKASFTIPGGLGELSHALKYSQNALSTLGLSDDQSVLLNATLNRMGLSGSRGGTTAVAALTRSIPGIFGSGLLTGKSGEALRTMGMADASGHSTVFSNGKFDTLKFMSRLADYEQSEYGSNPEAIARQHILENLQRAGGVNGARGMELLASPAAFAALRTVQDSLSKGSGTAAVQQTFADQSVYQQFENAKTNVTTLMSELGYTLLPTVSEGLKGFNGGIQRLIDLTRAHPNVSSGLMYAGAGVAGILATGAALNMGRFALGGFGLFRDIAAISTAATPAQTAISAAGGAVAVGGMLAGLAVFFAGVAGAYNEISAHAGFFKQAGSNLASSGYAGLGFQMGKGESWASRVLHGGLTVQPPSSAGQTTVHTTVNLDGKTLAKVVTQHQSNQVGGPTNSGSTFDPRMSFAPPSASGAW